MIRPDANSIALRATRSILDAVHDFKFELAGKPISVKCTKQAAPAWPRADENSPLEGLDERTDAPWPTPVTVDASWEGGASRLIVQCEFWRRTDEWAHAVGLKVSIAETRREILWSTFMFPIAEAVDGAAVEVAASVAMFKSHADEDRKSFIALGDSLRSLIKSSGIPMLSPAKAHLCSVTVPSGVVTPDPATIFERAIVIGIAKHAWFERRERSGFRGTPFVDVAFATALAVPPGAAGESGTTLEDDVSRGEKRAGIWPLPGGVRAYRTSLEALLKDIEEREPLSIAGLERLFHERYQVTGKAALRGYRFVLRATGYVVENDGEIALTATGQAWLARPDARDLFETLHATFMGMLEPLVLADLDPKLPRARVQAVLREVLDTRWQTGNQVDFRRNWLLSLGLTERTAEGDALTAAGAEVLAAHAREVEVARARLREALAAPVAELRDDASEEVELDVEVSGLEAASVPPLQTPGWYSAQLELSAPAIRAHLGRLRLDERVLQQLAAAVSSGKHVLFVGPPGTGKTELACALARAAEAEGYCTGLFTATASADWTTFDTIGGYSIQKDQTLGFRPGAFLRAIQEQT